MKKVTLLSRISITAILFVSNTSFAGLLMPIGVNDLYIYDKYNSTNPQDKWTMYIQGLEQVDIGGIEYIKTDMINEDGAGSHDEDLSRSTETALYFKNGDILFQIAPIGTTWSYPSYYASLGSGNIVNEIVGIETVTVPYGTFDNTYVQQAYFDPDDPLLDNTPYWYEYIVPDIGWVKQVDYWTPGTAIVELKDITTVPIPVAMWMFISGMLSLTALAKRRRRIIT